MLSLPGAMPVAMPLSALEDARSPPTGQPFVGQQNFTLSGVTYDQTGAPLGSCAVELFITGTDVLAARTVSDPTSGAYLLYVNPAFKYYAVGYKAGATDVSGTTRNDLVPS